MEILNYNVHTITCDEYSRLKKSWVDSVGVAKILIGNILKDIHKVMEQ